MARTIQGGAYLSADGKTWHNANGEVIPAPAIATVKAETATADKNKKVDSQVVAASAPAPAPAEKPVQEKKVNPAPEKKSEG